MGTFGGITIEQENLFDEVGHGLERPNEVNKGLLVRKLEIILIISEQHALSCHVNAVDS